MRRKTYLALALLAISNLAIPILGTGSLSIGSNGTISYPSRLLYGVCSAPWTLTERDCQEMRNLGVKHVRMDFLWIDFERTRDAPFDFSKYDRFLQLTKSYGLQIVAFLWTLPSWLIPAGGDKFTIPTGTDFDDFVTQYGQFVYAVVNHFKDEIIYFEVWNEPNNYGFWKDPEGTIEGIHVRGKAITKYVALLTEAYTQAKAANPNCKIVTGGLSENDYVYVQGIYENGAKGYFDYLGLHPYFWRSSWDPDFVDWNSSAFDYLPKIKLVRDLMVANGDESKDIFITEVGIGGATCTNEELQANRTKRTVEKIRQEYPFVNAIMWYQFRDKGGSESPNWGLLRNDYTPRQMYEAYREAIRSP